MYMFNMRKVIDFCLTYWSVYFWSGLLCTTSFRWRNNTNI